MKHVLLLTIAVACPATVVGAGSASPATSQWQDIGGGKVRLVAAMAPESAEVATAVEFRLEPGWKTYWREPGGSGIPPQFDFSGSRHFVAGDVKFPTPERLEAGGAVFAGYRDSVLFPVSGQAMKLAPDGVIRLNLFAGVCENICIPATAQLEIRFQELMRSDPATQALLDSAQEKLPGEPEKGFRVVSARRQHDNSLQVHALVPEHDQDPALFIEGPAGWLLPPAQFIGREDGIAKFRVDVVDEPTKDSSTDNNFRFTLVSGNHGVEQWLSIE
jgi:DsbC/DsbD-like thiol-disulfide interchange protein